MTEAHTIEMLVPNGDGTVQSLSAGERACVLIVDDTPAKLMSLSAIVSSMKLDAVTATSGSEALRKLLKQDFAVILLDVRMPVMDGYETAQLIRSRPRSAYTPIIFITAEAMGDEERVRGYGLGAVDWMLSPIMPEILMAKIKVFTDLFYLNRIAQRQAEELQAHNDRLGQELKSMAQILQPVGSSEKAMPSKVRNEINSEVLSKIMVSYRDLLEQAVKRQTHKEEYDISGALRAIAEEMALLDAGPRDVVVMHNQALKPRFDSIKSEAKNTYFEEARLMVLELMGYLARCYQVRATKLSSTQQHSEKTNSKQRIEGENL
jgi:CheY-like chemotaxis protein